jgi:ribulose-bisphosphate carboxylase small chain
MRLTQGAFSFLPDLDDRQIAAQIEHCLRQGWAVSVEFTDDPHPRNTYGEMWGMPMFDLHDAAGVMQEIKACRAANPETYVRVNAFDSTRGWETVRLSFLVQRPSHESGFRLERQEAEGRTVRYTLAAYGVDRPAGRRYGPEQARSK